MRNIHEKYPDKRVSGRFALPTASNIIGELKLDGNKSGLDLISQDRIAAPLPDGHIFGTLHDLTKVTLVDSVFMGHGYTLRNDETVDIISFFPHYMLFGEAHLAPGESCITAISLVIDDAEAIFGDQAFGHIFAASDIMGHIAGTKEGKDLEVGPYPIVVYYTGKRDIVTAETPLGIFAAHHNPSFGGAGSAYLANKISVGLDFASSVTFRDAMARMLTCLRFLELLIGRPQNILEMSVLLPPSPGKEHPVDLDVYWSATPRRDSEAEGAKPHRADILVSPVRDAASFADIMRRWLELDPSRLNARLRFWHVFGHQGNYTIDRIVAAANMFDILPDDATPAPAKLSPELLDAKKQARALFKALPSSLEKDDMLDALGRIGRSSLRRKVRHRAEPIANALPQLFPDLTLVTDQAVKCRNYYVHGGPSPIPYAENFDAVRFLTDTLEFVFAASDLMDAGWDIGVWVQRNSMLSHPFGRYLRGYEGDLQALRKLIAAMESKA